MCMYSLMVQAWMHPSWPKELRPSTQPFLPSPNSMPWPKIESDPKLAEMLLEALKRLEAIDKRLGKLEQCKVAEPKKKLLRKHLKKIADKAHRSTQSQNMNGDLDFGDDLPFEPYDVTCARCGKVLPCNEAIIEEGDEWECPTCWERLEREQQQRENAARSYGSQTEREHD